jgi:DNA-binding CsgD family transcriptional regulator
VLFLSVRTIGNHINHLYAKLGIGSREELRLALHLSGTDVASAHEADR